MLKGNHLLWTETQKGKKDAKARRKVGCMPGNKHESSRKILETKDVKNGKPNPKLQKELNRIPFYDHEVA